MTCNYFFCNSLCSTKKDTFKNVEKWLTEIKSQGEQDCMHYTRWDNIFKVFACLWATRVTCSNSVKLILTRPKVFCIFVTQRIGFAEKHGMPFLETSAATSSNVEQAFYLILQEIFKYKRKGAIGSTTNSKVLESSEGTKIKLDQPDPAAIVTEVNAAPKKDCAC